MGTHKWEGIIQCYLTWDFGVWLSLNYKPRKAICWKRHIWEVKIHLLSIHLWAKTLYLTSTEFTWPSYTKLEGETEPCFYNSVLFLQKQHKNANPEGEITPRYETYWALETGSYPKLLPCFPTNCPSSCMVPVYMLEKERWVCGHGYNKPFFSLRGKHKHSLLLPQIVQLSSLYLGKLQESVHPKCNR